MGWADAPVVDAGAGGSSWDAPTPTIVTVPAAQAAPAWAAAPIVGADGSVASVAKGGALGGVAMGLRDPIDAGAQLVRRIVPDWIGKPVDAFGNYLAEHGFPVTPSDGVAGVDNVVKNANADYDASRQMAGRDGIDLARIGGNIVNPVNWAVPMGGVGTTLGSIATRGAAQGALSGVLSPVTNTDNFWQQKFEQGSIGAAAGGALAPAAHAVSQVGTDVGARIRGMISSPDAATIDSTIAAAVQKHGIDLSQIHPDDMADVRSQVAAALGKGRDLDPAAAIRMAEGERVLGADANLTLGQATRDPKQFTAEKNMRGAPGGEPLMDRYNAQSGALVNALNDAGATGAPGAYQTGDRLINALRGANNDATANVSSLYDKANALNAGAVPLDSAAFANAADAALNPAGGISKTAFLPGEIKGILNDISSGKTPLTLSVAEQFKTMLANASRNASDGNVRTAIGHVRDALESAPPAVQLGEDASNAFAAARSAHAARMSAIDSNPALAAAVDDVAPDKFFSKYVLNGNARDLQNMTAMLSDSAGGAPAPSVIGDIRKEIVNHLKTKSLSGAEDDVGTFSQSGYKKALDNLGDERLSAFFTPEEIDGLHRIGRVASNAQVAPAGNAVNTSNTAGAAYTFLGGLLKNLPFASAISKGASDAGTKINVGNALASKVPAKAPEAAVNALRPLLTPFAGAGASTSSELVQ